MRMQEGLSLPHWSAGQLILWPNLRSGMLRIWTLSLVICVCGTLFGTTAWQLWQMHNVNIQQTEVVTSNTARSMAVQAETTLKTADTIVVSLVQQVEAEGTGPEARTRLHSLMTSLAAALPAIHEMGIIDSRGDAIVKSLVPNPAGMNYAEREYFRFHATNPDRGPFIGSRIKSKVDGTYNITVTRRINHADGSFAGVVVTSVSMKFFQQLFDLVQAQSGGIIALLADDDTILARSPAAPSEIGGPTGTGQLRQQMLAHPQAGSMAYRSDVDGVQRYGSYQHLSEFPLSTVVSQSEWDMQSSWRSALRSSAIIMVGVTLVVGVLGFQAFKANRMLNTQATHDSLTGMANRRFFDRTIEREFRRAARTGQPISVIMIDIDRFKDYNDSYGHPVGDECLCVIARTLQSCLRRASDLAARYGGEEFAVLLPGSGAPDAYALAETMRLAARNLTLQHPHNPGGIVTFSAGVATSVPGRTAGGWEALVKDADAALYAAKAAGRDTVKTCPPTSPGAIGSAVGAYGPGLPAA